MKKKTLLRTILCAMLAAMCLLTAALPAMAADVKDATIDMTKKGSLTIYKYDSTNAEKDGAWSTDDFTSTSWMEQFVEQAIGNIKRKNAPNDSLLSQLGNGESSNGYAIKGVEFTTLRVADIVTFTESVRDGHTYNLTQLLYGFDKTAAADLLTAIGLENGKDRYENADVLDGSKYYYTSDTLNRALAAALKANSTTVKNALEAYVAASEDAIVMDETDENGRTSCTDLQLGLYIVIETKVPEMVTSTTDPFFVSVPMTTVSGNENSVSPEGGHQWNYDVVVYPKNQTGIPSLEKTVREQKDHTGKNEGSDSITDGYAHTATASAGDVLDYQIISTLPTITSQATALTVYSFSDTLSVGLTYNRDVQIDIFSDEACTQKVASWTEEDGKFSVEYSEDGQTMNISVTQSGLDEINGSTPNENGALYAGYANYTVRVTYTATLDSDTDAVFGEDGNCNKVVLTWKRTSSSYYDTLIDDCHVYTFGIHLIKHFESLDDRDAATQGKFDHVKFKIYNETDGYWLTAGLNAEEGVYYATGHVAEEADATIFTPVTSGDLLGRIIVKGVEDDTYILTECETANGYTLLKDAIRVNIATAENASAPCDIYAQDALGVLQNDPRYSFDGGLDLKLAGIPQKQLHHDLLTASATVDGNAVTMEADDGSANAIVPLTVVNMPGFDLPQTGERGMWIFTLGGAALLAVSCSLMIFVATRKKKEKN